MFFEPVNFSIRKQTITFLSDVAMLTNMKHSESECITDTAYLYFVLFTQVNGEKT